MNIVEKIAQTFFLEEKEIKLFINTAPYRYRVYQIPKRNNKGMRTIAQPIAELKVIQKFILSEFFHVLPVHDCATAYRKNINIRENVLSHAKNQYILKVDFKDFFTSITSDDFIKHIQRHIGELSYGDKISVKKIFFWKRKEDSIHRLSIGSPSSPFISNTIMYEFDTILQNICSEFDITYTRYADDITLSTNVKDTLFQFPERIEKICAEIDYPTLKINKDKTIFSSKKCNRHITGLVITNEGKISLGRKDKRYIKSMVFNALQSKLTHEEFQKLKGLLAFAKHIEPDFIKSLNKKYELDVLQKIFDHIRN